MGRGHDMGEIWVKRRVVPSLAWGHNKALCRAVEWSSDPGSGHITEGSAHTRFTQLLSFTDQYGRRYLNRGASESAFWSSRHHF